ncbi:NAD(P)-binding protein [Aspergillus pseudoustus]|uniref:NAD(P)-binding protein n=1 Tax=Aspergillus pseudoustus TaxID=1810923 RepID=A0ABR4K956_9EURO
MAIIPSRPWVLVTGANGYLASHIVDQLLLAGYNARGTVRALGKGQWLSEFLTKKYGLGRFELAEVPEMAAPGAFTQSVKGVSAIVHTASDMTFGPDPNEVVSRNLKGNKELLEAAVGEPLVKRFVLTSSAAACSWPHSEGPFDVDEKTWNTGAVERAWAPPPYDAGRAWDVYAASKTQQEQETWAFVEARKPQFTVNSVIPNTLFGPLLVPEKQTNTSTNGFVTGIYKTGWTTVEYIPPQYHCDVRDIARLHIVAIQDPDIANERIFGYGDKYSYNDIMDILRKVSPEHEFPENKPGLAEDQSRILHKGRAEELLRKHYGQNGFIGLEETIKDTVAHIVGK